MQTELGTLRAAARATSEARSTWLTALLLGLIALVPRVVGLAGFITTDEAYHWVEAVRRFDAAFETGDWAWAILHGHPGVTLWWLGSLGLAAQRLALAQGWIAQPTALEHLAWLRTPPAILEALLVPVAYLLLRRLVARPVALIAALLWATSPFLITHSRVFHMDMLLGAFVTLSLLALLNGSRGERRARWYVVGGACTGLALLTKGSALISLPILGLLLLWHLRRPGEHPLRWLGRAAAWYGLWLGCAALVFVLLWPVMWSDPGYALQRYFDEIFRHSGRPNGVGDFFLGRALQNPGPLFYPLAALFRMTPLTLLGLLGLPLALRRPEQRPVLLSMLFALFFWGAVMTVSKVKFDRYILPMWPALLLLAAAGWAELLQRASGWWARRAATPAPATEERAGTTQTNTPLLRPFLALALLLELGQLALYHPYYLSYYNPLLGGGAVAQQVFLIGWGEGMDQAGAFLAARPDIQHGPILSALPATLQPFVPVPVKEIAEHGKDPANYAVVYLESLQRQADSAIYQRIRETEPLLRIRIHGIDYAAIHQLAKPYDQRLDAAFGDSIRLRGVSVEQLAGTLVITPSWDIRATPAADYHVFMHLFNQAGEKVMQIDAPPGGAAVPPSSRWLAGEQIAVPLPMPLPAGLPAGQYTLSLGLYDPQSGARVPLTAGPRADERSAGPDALLLATLTL